MRNLWSDRFHQLLDGQLRKAERHHLTGEEAARLNVAGKTTPSGQPFRGGMLASGENRTLHHRAPQSPQTFPAVHRTTESFVKEAARLSDQRLLADHQALQALPPDYPLDPYTPLGLLRNLLDGRRERFDEEETRQLLGRIHGDPQALAQHHQQLYDLWLTRNLRIDNVLAEFADHIDYCHTRLTQEYPAYMRAEQRYGTLLTALATGDRMGSQTPTASGEFFDHHRYTTGPLRIIYQPEWAKQKNFERFQAEDTADSPRLYLGGSHTVGEANRPSAVSTLRHEYGHFVHTQISSTAKRKCRRLAQAYITEIKNNPALIPISPYSLDNSYDDFAEPFAEAFSMVTHPDYPNLKNNFAPATRAFLDFVERQI